MAAAAPNPTEQRETRETEKAGKSVVVVDLGEAHPIGEVKRLRRGKGKLFQHVERIVSDLVEAGTVKANAQPVVIVVREFRGVWPFYDTDD